MQILDRIIIFIFTVLLIFISLIMIGSAVELIPQSYITAFINQYYGQAVVGVIGAILLLVALRILYPLFKKKEKNKNTIVRENSLGQIRISLLAIDALVNKAVTQTRGVKEVESKLKVGEKGLNIFLEVIVTPDINIPEISEELQESIKEYLKQTTGVVVGQIEVLVDKVAQDSNLRVE
ncbi:alkaline shock response membrane anchor protein AmaP [Sporohalobacter salinus]|uniref:alkaline shock response membrane anchor protein AmaP n=1 Tax=Sporohalobacter salinus TaxID=1494606 RepID=UPI001961297B|nr:alkaline shock response membrane anchor protein AmaP [Sporohalobacter salinus]MBM7622760.1 putative alkaline shock family protein YloU [Sporohalobacter salinus]